LQVKDGDTRAVIVTVEVVLESMTINFLEIANIAFSNIVPTSIIWKFLWSTPCMESINPMAMNNVRICQKNSKNFKV